MKRSNKQMLGHTRSGDTPRLAGLLCCLPFYDRLRSAMLLLTGALPTDSGKPCGWALYHRPKSVPITHPASCGDFSLFAAVFSTEPRPPRLVFRHFLTAPCMQVRDPVICFDESADLAAGHNQVLEPTATESETSKLSIATFRLVRYGNDSLASAGEEEWHRRQICPPDLNVRLLTSTSCLASYSPNRPCRPHRCIF